MKESILANNTPRVSPLARSWTKKLMSEFHLTGGGRCNTRLADRSETKLTVTRSGDLGCWCAETYKVSCTIVGMHTLGGGRVQAQVLDPWVCVGLFGIDGSRSLSC